MKKDDESGESKRPQSGPEDAPPGGKRKRPEDPGGGILMGRPFGVPVYVAPSWFLVAALITWVFGGQLDRVLPHLGGVRYLVALFFAVAFYASVLVHELAHTVVALRYKLPVRRIQLQFFGGVSEIEKESETPAASSCSRSSDLCSPSSWPASSTSRWPPSNPARSPASSSPD